jgi:Histidine kinase-, DNA gyrase B-, and HSP90-like ATPase
LLSHAFEPYVTTKVHGTGLGLAIVKKMIEEHFGQIKIENNPTGGACITIVLPIDKNNVTKLETKANLEKKTEKVTPAKKRVKKHIEQKQAEV